MEVWSFSEERCNTQQAKTDFILIFQELSQLLVIIILNGGTLWEINLIQTA
jgi:hypothetical protein